MMTGFGISHIFSLLLAMSGFGVDANPKAPSADVVLAHAVEDADVVIAVDVAAIAPRNLKALNDLPQHPAIKADPELQKMVKQVTTELNGARQMAKGVVGFDPATDLTSFVIYMRATPKGGDPEGLIELRGKLPADIAARVAKAMGGQAEAVDGRPSLAIAPPAYLGVAADGAVLLGTPALVKPRLANAWKAPARPAGSALARTAALLDEKPFATVAVHPSANMLASAVQMHGSNFGLDLAKDADFFGMSLRATGVTWSHYMKSKGGFERVGMMMDGMIDLMRAAQIAPRGFAKIAVAALDSYGGRDPQLDDLIKHKADIIKVVEAYTGDGQFKAQIDRDPKAKSVVVRATGKTLSEVLPGIALPMVVLGTLVYAGAKSPAPAMPASSGASGSTGVAVSPKPAPTNQRPTAPAKPAHP